MEEHWFLELEADKVVAEVPRTTEGAWGEEGVGHTRPRPLSAVFLTLERDRPTGTEAFDADP